MTNVEKRIEKMKAKVDKLAPLVKFLIQVNKSLGRENVRLQKALLRQSRRK